MCIRDRLELQNLVRDALLMLIAVLSLVLTPNEHREANGFTWDPIAEVAILFGGIFACIIPVLCMRQAAPAGSFSWLLTAATAAGPACSMASTGIMQAKMP